MNKLVRVARAVALVIGAMAVSSGSAGTTGAAAPAKVVKPRLVDLGAGRCIPCRQMAPILERLRDEYAGKFEVMFIDV